MKTINSLSVNIRVTKRLVIQDADGNEMMSKTIFENVQYTPSKDSMLEILEMSNTQPVLCRIYKKMDSKNGELNEINEKLHQGIADNIRTIVENHDNPTWLKTLKQLQVKKEDTLAVYKHTTTYVDGLYDYEVAIIFTDMIEDLTHDIQPIIERVENENVIRL